MIVARVRGTLVAASQVNPSAGRPYMLVEPCDEEGNPAGPVFVALDTVGSGVGEVVLVAQGSSARQTMYTKDKPVDAVIVGIIDLIEKKGKIVFKK